MTKNLPGQHSDIEEAQAALRESIEQAKELTEKSDGLLQKHKRKRETQAAAEERDAYRRENPL